MTTRLVAALLSVTAILAAPADGQTVVVPQNPIPGGMATVVSAAARTYQAAYDGPLFGSITGPVRITGMQFRLGSPRLAEAAAAWPSRDLTWADYTVQMSQPSAGFLDANGFPMAPTGLPGTTFAANQGADVTTVRSGPLSIAAGSYTQAGQPGVVNAFGPVIPFGTPYLYEPGNVVLLTIGHSGHGTAGVAAGFMAVTDYQVGTADAVVFNSGKNFDATPAGFANPLVVQFTYEPVGAPTPTPEPGAVLAVAAAAAGAVRLRRRIRGAP